MSKRSPSLYLLEAIELSKEEHKGNPHILKLLNTLQQEYM